MTEALRLAIRADQNAGKRVWLEAYGSILWVPPGVEFAGMDGRAVMFRAAPVRALQLVGP